MKIDVIYVDMDGVIADFTKRYKELYRMAPKEAENKKVFGKLFQDFIDTRQFATLEPYSGGEALLKYLDSFPHIPKEILSSTAREDSHGSISQQKTEWLKTMNISYKTNFVPGKRFKYKFATPNSILIDDTESNIKDWNEAGGIGILHQDVFSTIAILGMYLDRV